MAIKDSIAYLKARIAVLARMKQQNELAGAMRKLSILLTTIALSCVGFASSPANALGTPYSCTTGGFYVLNGVVFGGGPLEGDCTG